MKQYRIIVRTETHIFSFIIEAKSRKDAFQKGYNLHGDLVNTATIVDLTRSI
jgi:hypothetical protein